MSNEPVVRLGNGSHERRWFAGDKSKLREQRPEADDIKGLRMKVPDRDYICLGTKDDPTAIATLIAVPTQPGHMTYVVAAPSHITILRGELARKDGHTSPRKFKDVLKRVRDAIAGKRKGVA